MREYTIIYKKGHSKEIASPDKTSLIKDHFNDNPAKFKSEVARLKWTSLATQYVEDVQSGKVHAQIFSADVNPYGWRN